MKLQKKYRAWLTSQRPTGDNKIKSRKGEVRPSSIERCVAGSPDCSKRSTGSSPGDHLLSDYHRMSASSTFNRSPAAVRIHLFQYQCFSNSSPKNWPSINKVYCWACSNCTRKQSMGNMANARRRSFIHRSVDP